MDKDKFKKLIERYQADQATPAERYIVERWYESLSDGKAHGGDLADQVDQAAFQEQIVHAARMTDDGPKVLWYKRRWLQVAALFLCVFSAVLVIYLRSAQEEEVTQGQEPASQFVHTGVRQVKHLVLPDSSVVYLNANSEIEIPADFNQADRTVRLSGEAYFDIQADAARPFRVYADGLEVKVLGTAFNINAYGDLNNIQVAVNTGKVQVAEKDSVLALLEHDERLVYDKKTALVARFTMASASRFSWKDGVTMLDKASFGELAQVIYNNYGVRLVSADDRVRMWRYNFTVRSSRTLEQTMEQLCEMIKKRYRKEGDRIIIY